MKGMQKIKRGKSFAGVVLYVLKPGSLMNKYIAVACHVPKHQPSFETTHRTSSLKWR